LSERLAALVVDVAGPVPWTVRDADLEALAAGYVAAGAGLTARRGDPLLESPSWEPNVELVDACTGVEVYALDIELPERAGARSPALGLVLPDDVAPVPVAERLLAAADRPLDLLLVSGERLEIARRCGRRL
jgi:hypothetical protein